MHSIWGSPIYPAGQAHFALWKITLQNALGAQGSSYAQGFLHAPFKQAAYSGHSELLLQPTTTSMGVRGTVNKHSAKIEGGVQGGTVWKNENFTLTLKNYVKTLMFKLNQFHEMFLEVKKE